MLSILWTWICHWVNGVLYVASIIICLIYRIRNRIHYYVLIKLLPCYNSIHFDRFHCTTEVVHSAWPWRHTLVPSHGLSDRVNNLSSGLCFISVILLFLWIYSRPTVGIYGSVFVNQLCKDKNAIWQCFVCPPLDFFRPVCGVR